MSIKIHAQPFFPVRPLTITLDKDIKNLSTNRTYELKCEVTGSRPTPSLSWWKGSSQLRNTKEWVDMPNIHCTFNF